jgi:hypothetical protein
MNRYSISHSEKDQLWITQELRSIGVDDFRYCVENDCYVCDKHGNFYSVCKRQVSRSGNPISKYRILRLRGSTDKYGYVTYRVTVNGIKKHLKGHRMMLNAWVGEHPDLVVNHLDGNKQNNDLLNLEWCTVAENNRHAIETGLFDPHARKVFHYSVQPADWMSVYVMYKHCGWSLSALGRMCSCNHDTIKAIIRRIDSVMPEEVLNEQ